MDFARGEEQEQLQLLVRAFLAEHSTEEDVRRLMDTDEGYDPGVWKKMAAEVGLQGLTIAEELGGAGSGFVELCIAMEEMGASLLCAPYLSTAVLAAEVLKRSDEQVQQRWLPAIAEGAAIATVALGEAGASPTALAPPEAGRLTGVQRYTLDGQVADLILVPAGDAVYAIEKSAGGFTADAILPMDQTRKLAHVTFDAEVSEPIASITVLDEVVDLAAIALGHEQLGGAQRCLDMSVEYAKTRIQFGRPIGSFQAVKHKCADMLVDIEMARSAAYHAAGAAAAGDIDEVAIMAPLVKSSCSEAYMHAAAENIQIHGGIGFTWEHSAHLYFKRAKASELLFGDPTEHRARLADRLGL